MRASIPKNGVATPNNVAMSKIRFGFKRDFDMEQGYSTLILKTMKKPLDAL